MSSQPPVTGGASPETSLKQALALYRQEKPREAYDICLNIIDMAPAFHPALHLAGVIAFDAGHHDVAEQMLLDAISLAPEQATYHSDLALPLRAQEKLSEALDSLDAALRISPDLHAALNIKASLASHLGRGQLAVATLRRLSELRKNDPSVLIRLGLALRNQGDRRAAQSCLEQALELQPESAAAYWLLSSVIKANKDHNHIAQMQALLQAFDSPDSGDRGEAVKPGAAAEVELCFALAKEYEDMAQFDCAFEYLARGNGQRRKQLSYDSQAEKTLFNSMQATFTAEFINRYSEQARRGDDDTMPVFIVGMPRTGSTLLERILASHTEVTSAGELQVLEGVLQREAHRLGHGYPGLVTMLGKQDLARLAAEYLLKSRPFRDEAQVFIDKMPMNFLHIGLIKMLLPQAKIINLRRDPVDTCFSCYKQLFGAQYRFSYSLQELADYYRLYDTLMKHWHAVLPDQIIDVQYEELVSDTEAVARRVIEYCGLPWQADCLAFRNSSDSVRTPSAMQVREAPHQRSVGRWREFESHLAPLLDALA